MKTPSKKLPWFTACTLVLTTFILACAQEPESNPGAQLPKKQTVVDLGSPVTSTDRVPPKAVAEGSLEVIERRLSSLEEKLDRLDAAIKLMTSGLAKGDVEAIVEEKLKAQKSSDPKSAVSGETTIAKKDTALVDIQINMKSMALQIGDLRADIQNLAVDLPKTLKGAIAADLPKPKEREAVILIRNRTGDSQIFYVEDESWRIPSDGDWYTIPVTLRGDQDSVSGQVYPFDRPKRRVFTEVEGRFVCRVDITLQPVR